MDNNELIQQSRELCEKATPGPWISEPMTSKKARRGGGSYFRVAREELFVNICHYLTKHDAAFIAASRILVPQLCDALEVVQKELQEFQKIGVTAAGIEELYDSYTRENAELTVRAEKAEANVNHLINQAEEYKQKFNTALVRAEKAEVERDAYKAVLQNWHEAGDSR